jgi:hypothetical protein
MRLLRVLVVVMGVMIVAGVAALGVLLTRRIGAVPASAAAVSLDEPQGTGIASVSAAADSVAVQLRGGGPDRVVVIDLRSGRVTGKIGLQH